MKAKINKNKINLSAVGNKADIYLYVDERNSEPVKSYIDSLQESEMKKIIRLFQLMLEQGEIKNKEKFKQLEKNIFEFKSEPHRVLCFILPGFKKKSFVLTNAFKKEKDKTPKTQIIKANSIKQEILLIN